MRILSSLDGNDEARRLRLNSDIRPEGHTGHIVLGNKLQLPINIDI